MTVLSCELCSALFVAKTGNANRFCSRWCAYRKRRLWSDDFIEKARTMWIEGYSASDIAFFLSTPGGPKITKNTIIGISNRNDFPSHGSPVKNPRREQ